MAVRTSITARHRVTGGGRPPPVPTERSVQISRTTLFRRGFTALRELVRQIELFPRLGVGRRPSRQCDRPFARRLQPGRTGSDRDRRDRRRRVLPPPSPATAIGQYIDAEDCNRPAIGLQHTKAASRTADLLPVVDPSGRTGSRAHSNPLFGGYF